MTSGWWSVTISSTKTTSERSTSKAITTFTWSRFPEIIWNWISVLTWISTRHSQPDRRVLTGSRRSRKRQWAPELVWRSASRDLNQLWEHIPKRSFCGLAEFQIDFAVERIQLVVYS